MNNCKKKNPVQNMTGITVLKKCFMYMSIEVS